MIQPNTPPFTNGTEEAQERYRIFQGPTVISATEAGLKSRPPDFSPMLPPTHDRAGPALFQGALQEARTPRCKHTEEAKSNDYNKSHLYQ